MSKIYQLEPMVTKALKEKPETRSDNFALYNEVLANFIDIDSMSIGDVFRDHKELGIPSLESITRCRRKLQERDRSLRPDSATTEARKAEESEMIEYAMADKAWY